MKCASAIDRMLEADPQELSGEGTGELAGHLASCDRCCALAEQIVEGQLGLARELETQSPRLSAEDGLRIAEKRSSAIRRRNAIWQIGAPLAAAAGITGIVLAGNGGVGVKDMALTRGAETLPGLEVQAPPGKDVAVFGVADRPDVVVVWFFNAGDD